MHVYYLELRPEVENVVDRDASAAARERAAQGFQYCPECGVRIDPRPLRVDGFVLRCPRNTWAPAGTASAVREELINILQGNLSGCYIGKCVNTSVGEECRGYVSCSAAPCESMRLVLRGGPRSQYYPCEACGFVRMGYIEGRGYYLKHQFEPGRHVYPMGFTFLVTEEFAKGVDWSRFPDIQLFKYQVLDRPRDGQQLPGDPEWD